MKSNEIGKVLCDRFEILDVLGAGGMGVVYKAHDRNMDVDVALKVMRSGSADNDDLRKRLEREGRLMAKLRQHANIVTIYERVIQDGDIHLVMDYINGEDLHKLIQRTLKFREEGAGTIEISSPKPLACLDQTSAITIAIQALNALQFAHTQGILHRDIKPGNIMVTRDPNGKLQVFLMDFGIATAIRESMNSSSLMSMLQPQQGSSPGTPAYMAPEQIDRNNFGPLDHRADLYAFGVTLFQMLTLQMPFDSAISAYDAHLYLQPRDPSELPTALRQILKKALQKKASDRYQNAAEFRNDLETFIGTAPLAQPTAQVVDTAQPAPHVSDTNTVLVTSRTPPPRQKRTNKLLIGVVLCLLVGLCTLACAGWYFVHHIPGWFTATNSQPQTALGASTAAPSTSPAQVIPAPSPAAISVTPAPATPLTQESVVAPLDTPTAIPAPEKITSALPPTPTPTPAVPLIQESIVAPQSTPPIATPSPEKTPVLTPTPTPVLTPKSRRTPIPEEEDAPVKQVKPKPTQMPSKLTNTFKWSSDRP